MVWFGSLTHADTILLSFYDLTHITKSIGLTYQLVTMHTIFGTLQVTKYAQLACQIQFILALHLEMDDKIMRNLLHWSHLFNASIPTTFTSFLRICNEIAIRQM